MKKKGFHWRDLYFVAVFLSQDLVRVHKSLLQEIQNSVHHKGAQNLYQIFITFKERCTGNFNSSPACLTLPQKGLFTSVDRRKFKALYHLYIWLQVVDLWEILQPCGNSHRPAGLRVQRQRGCPHETGGRADVSSQTSQKGRSRRQHRLLFVRSALFPTTAFMCGDNILAISVLFPAGVFKESKLRQVHAEGPAGGPDAASLEVPAPLAGTVLQSYCTTIDSAHFFFVSFMDLDRFALLILSESFDLITVWSSLMNAH